MIRLPAGRKNGPMDKAAERLRQFEEARLPPEEENGPPVDETDAGRKRPGKKPRKDRPEPPPDPAGRGEDEPASRKD
ncbi:MAG TPA: hypothetical protein ENI89_09795 [Desulfobulbus sp.]|nr:hypothetical protein [Desulfobulbus sp.]